MAKQATFLNEGKVIDVVLTAAVVVGEVVPVGTAATVGAGRVLVAQTAGAIGDIVACATTGVFQMTAETGVAWVVGDPLYWDDTNNYLSKTSTASYFAGFATEVKASATAVGKVRIG